MPVISLAIARHHLRDPDDADEYLELLIEAAEGQAMDYLNRRFYADQQALDEAVAAGDAGEYPLVSNKQINAACLLILGHLYANREDVVIGTIATELPKGSQALLTPHRIGWGV
ncbi:MULTISPECIES: head-tail connector protein [Pseudomonas]|uniref:Phage gp6-like head-tail connector protein n=1 Tax=Pseudomonas pudica TaxID=272772 RepID=A0ABS0G2P4_9PSED|nr:MULTISPECIES: head-tail connector protein [Pseudomonas]MBF8646871.1 phage gp6-like head-tail connector protein [Pseudomonas pudica]MBF8760839.1 phage gp6-like head-tail connector protein [Pseudomonas pudica]MDZ5111890.1 head-tail connector protein [Pseudomonas putida]